MLLLLDSDDGQETTQVKDKAREKLEHEFSETRALSPKQQCFVTQGRVCVRFSCPCFFLRNNELHNRELWAHLVRELHFTPVIYIMRLVLRNKQRGEGSMCSSVSAEAVPLPTARSCGCHRWTSAAFKFFLFAASEPLHEDAKPL